MKAKALLVVLGLLAVVALLPVGGFDANPKNCPTHPGLVSYRGYLVEAGGWSYCGEGRETSIYLTFGRRSPSYGVQLRFLPDKVESRWGAFWG